MTRSQTRLVRAARSTGSNAKSSITRVQHLHGLEPGHPSQSDRKGRPLSELSLVTYKCLEEERGLRIC